MTFHYPRPFYISILFMLGHTEYFLLLSGGNWYIEQSYERCRPIWWNQMRQQTSWKRILEFQVNWYEKFLNFYNIYWHAECHHAGLFFPSISDSERNLIFCVGNVQDVPNVAKRPQLLFIFVIFLSH